MSDKRWLKVLDADALPEGTVREIRCGNRSLCAVYKNGRVGVFDDVCPHQGSPLSTGWLFEGLIVCPWHGWAYDPIDGRPSSGLGAPLRMIASKLEADGLYIDADDVPES